MPEGLLETDVFLPCYRHLVDSDADINFLWGGRDSGKTHFIAQNLIIKCLESDYFRCILIKKTYESIKDSQFQTIKEIIIEWDLEEYFHFKESPLEITCVNGNKFIARGCDNPQKLKSIKNPSHAWYEEGNQLTEQDYITASTTLRGRDGQRVQEWFSFNPECDGDFNDFWLYKTYFKGREQNFEEIKTVVLPGGEVVELNYTSTHTTYADNEFCTAERRAKLEDLKTVNPYYYQVYTLGEWGVRQVDFPFFFNFDRTKHVGSVEWSEEQYTYLSFDFNRNPMCCSVVQWYDDKIRFVETIKMMNADTGKVCDYIKSKYPKAIFMVNGDSTGKNSSTLVEDGLNNYMIIRDKLGISDKQIHLLPNPKVEKNQTLCNAALAKMDILMDEENCQPLIFDMMFAEMMPNGQLKKGDRNDPKQQLDAGDTFRYWVNQYLREELHEYV